MQATQREIKYLTSRGWKPLQFESGGTDGVYVRTSRFCVATLWKVSKAAWHWGLRHGAHDSVGPGSRIVQKLSDAEQQVSRWQAWAAVASKRKMSDD